MDNRPDIKRIALFCVTKYFVFFIILGFLDDRFNTLVIDNSRNSSDIFSNIIGYLIEVIFGTIGFAILLIIPMFFLFKLNAKLIFPIFLVVVFMEYFMYESMAAYIHFDKDGIVNGIVSIVFFQVFFGRAIVSMRKQMRNNS